MGFILNAFGMNKKIIYILGLSGFIVLTAAWIFVDRRAEVPIQKASLVEEKVVVSPKIEEMPNTETKKLQWSNPPENKIDTKKSYHARLNTNKGAIKIELLSKETPVAVNNFVFLSREGFYNGTIFHRVIKGFMIQGGDPLGTGMGGPGYSFPDEPVKRSYTRGIVAMANAGSNTNGSQFFIMHQDYSLPPNYVIFGKVVEGLEVLDQIASTPVVPSLTGELSKPVEEILVESVAIEEI